MVTIRQSTYLDILSGINPVIHETFAAQIDTLKQDGLKVVLAEDFTGAILGEFTSQSSVSSAAPNPAPPTPATK
jgi:hypothetical protein